MNSVSFITRLIYTVWQAKNSSQLLDFVLAVVIEQVNTSKISVNNTHLRCIHVHFINIGWRNYSQNTLNLQKAFKQNNPPCEKIK